jgi:hypothetical protein
MKRWVQDACPRLYHTIETRMAGGRIDAKGAIDLEMARLFMELSGEPPCPYSFREDMLWLEKRLKEAPDGIR